MAASAGVCVGVLNDSRAICFEQPLNERARTLLRLEHLFEHAQHHMQDPSHWGRRATLTTLLDILTLLSRSDLKTEILKELSDRHTQLSRLQNRPGVDHARLAEVLVELQHLSEQLQQVPSQAANTLLKENEFLTSVLNRTGIPGGSCNFDVPAFHSWLNLPPETQARDIEHWYHDMRPFQEAARQLIRMVRESSTPVARLAESGVYIHTMEGPCQLVRILLPAHSTFYPEISAGKHRCTIRFMEHSNINQRPTQAQVDVSFQLVLCTL
jgi:cell division protein ZapD